MMTSGAPGYPPPKPLRRMPRGASPENCNVVEGPAAFKLELVSSDLYHDPRDETDGEFPAVQTPNHCR
jgi:hypothetical protein